ncbi:hypothetical protein DFH09DRAFT_1102941 [Mycena vulgaris]|nr:hypothetical protein DFH09DRAFT_1102941 [Mycena vulgaris]
MNVGNTASAPPVGDWYNCDHVRPLCHPCISQLLTMLASSLRFVFKGKSGHIANLPKEVFPDEHSEFRGQDAVSRPLNHFARFLKVQLQLRALERAETVRPKNPLIGSVGPIQEHFFALGFFARSHRAAPAPSQCLQAMTAPRARWIFALS